MSGHYTRLIAALLFLPATFCAADNLLEVQHLPGLPVPITNNAVALRTRGDSIEIYSFLGLESGKQWSDASRAALKFSAGSDPKEGAWTILENAPGEHGRLAASAVQANGGIFLFGGYTVAESGGEESTPQVYRLNGAGELEVFTTMPVPVEDSVVVVHEERWVYMVSGWHDVGNVNLVQVLDIENASWSQATPFPGSPVFGHAGGLVNGAIVSCDGVRIEYQPSPAPRSFLPSDECWSGAINTEDHRRIDWRRLPPHPGKPRYRMAAGSDGKSRVWFAGGSENPYNFNGIGYDGVPSGPEAGVFSFDVSTGAWEEQGMLPIATMDHRGLPYHEGWFYVVGGMRENQVVSDGFFRFKP